MKKFLRSIKASYRNTKKVARFYMKVTKRKMVAVYITAITTVITTAVPVMAAENKYARNLGDWVTDGLKTMGMCFAGYLCVRSLMKRKFVEAISTGVLCAVLIAFLFNPELFKTIGNYLTGIIFG